MKTIKYLLLICIALVFTNCQKEDVEIVDETVPNNVISSNSTLTTLISRVSQNPTSKDNVLDNSSCFSVQLPVTVIVNSQQITVTTAAQYQTVQDAINAFSNDDDIVNFVYPITINFQNFGTQVIANSNQLDDVLDDCDDDDGFDEIDCIAVNYPITINVYNTSTQQASTVTIQNNIQLFAFIATGLSTGVIATINYPISVTNSNGQSVVINDNTQLQDFIENSIDDCDDNSSGGGSGNNPTFTSVLTTGNWRITYSYDDGDQTLTYAGYNFTYNVNGTVTAVKNATSINGTWSTYIDSGENKFLLSFDGLVLDEIEEDWRILEFTNTTIVLKNISGGNGGTDYLTFTKN